MRLKSVSVLKSSIKSYEDIHSGIEDLKVLMDFYDEGEATEAEVESQYDKVIVVRKKMCWALS